MTGKGLPYLLDGQLAAALQGVPVRPRCLELAVAEADLDRLAEWVLAAPNWLRWSERWHDFSNHDIDPRRPGELRWGTPSGEIRFRLLPVLPVGLRMSHSGRRVRVRPLLELGGDDPQLARIIARARARTAVG
ncbi:hypothetical protein ACK8GG_02460 [Micromonosporaceae bacterium DT55]|uniref:hypothetical protein n=1 Tax=Melissospora conviva TaxID=3388432 RepID=UPI003C24A7C7